MKLFSFSRSMSRPTNAVARAEKGNQEIVESEDGRISLRFLNRIRYHWTKAREQNLRMGASYLKERAHRVLSRARAAVWKGQRLSPDLEIQSAFQSMYLAVQSYEPQPYDGCVVLFPRSDRIDDPATGWAGVATRFEILDVLGSHTTMFLEPHVEILAQKLGKCLGTTEPGGRRRGRPNISRRHPWHLWRPCPLSSKSDRRTGGPSGNLSWGDNSSAPPPFAPVRESLFRR